MKNIIKKIKIKLIHSLGGYVPEEFEPKVISITPNIITLCSDTIVHQGTPPEYIKRALYEQMTKALYEYSIGVIEEETTHIQYEYMNKYKLTLKVLKDD